MVHSDQQFLNSELVGEFFELSQIIVRLDLAQLLKVFLLEASNTTDSLQLRKQDPISYCHHEKNSKMFQI